MEFDAVSLPGRRAASVAGVLRPDRTISGSLDAAIAARADRIAIVAVEVEPGAERRLTYRGFGQAVDRLAIGLHRLGVGAGDLVAVQLPNWSVQRS